MSWRDETDINQRLLRKHLAFAENYRLDKPRFIMELRMPKKITAEYKGNSLFKMTGKQVCFANIGDEIVFEFEDKFVTFKFADEAPKAPKDSFGIFSPDIAASLKNARLDELKLIATKLCVHCRQSYKPDFVVKCDALYVHQHAKHTNNCMGNHSRTCMAGPVWERIWELEKMK